MVGHLLPTLVPSLLLNHQSLIGSLVNSTPEVSTIIRVLAMVKLVVVNAAS